MTEHQGYMRNEMTPVSGRIRRCFVCLEWGGALLFFPDVAARIRSRTFFFPQVFLVMAGPGIRPCNAAALDRPAFPAQWNHGT